VLTVAKAGSHNENAAIVRCEACGLIFVSPRVAQGALENQYTEETFQEAYFRDLYLPQAEALRGNFRYMLSLVAKRRAPPGRLRDIGCAVGLLVDEARKMGYEARGHELSTWAARYAREKLGLEVASGVLAELGEASEDVVTFVETIEHLPDPLAALKEIRRILRPGGACMVTTPNWRSVERWRMGRSWEAIAPDGHIYYFDARTLTRHLELAGFSKIEVLTRGCRVAPFRWSYKWLDAVERAGYGAQLVAFATR
jgi:2-polyprenyl-3-methyl-5-hydroxy-6-metoxy-1,4-benzoquinol methylase